MCTLNFRTTFGHLDLTTAQPHHLSMIMLKVKLAAVAVAPSGPAGGSFLVWGVFFVSQWKDEPVVQPQRQSREANGFKRARGMNDADKKKKT